MIFLYTECVNMFLHQQKLVSKISISPQLGSRYHLVDHEIHQLIFLCHDFSWLREPNSDDYKGPIASKDHTRKEKHPRNTFSGFFFCVFVCSTKIGVEFC